MGSREVAMSVDTVWLEDGSEYAPFTPKSPCSCLSGYGSEMVPDKFIIAYAGCRSEDAEWRVLVEGG